MISLQGMEENLDTALAVREPDEEPKVTIPWEKIDEWIASIDQPEEKDVEARVIDAGERRN